MLATVSVDVAGARNNPPPIDPLWIMDDQRDKSRTVINVRFAPDCGHLKSESKRAGGVRDDDELFYVLMSDGEIEPGLHPLMALPETAE